jgi:hypothetical protein
MDELRAIREEQAIEARARAAGLRACPVARLRVRWPHGVLDVLFVEGGERGGTEGIVWTDWRSSPLGAALLDGRRRIEVVTRGERVVGTAIARSFLEHDASGSLCRVERGARAWERARRGWRRVRGSRIDVPARSERERARTMTRLDARQARAVALPMETSLLVLGAAGHGKTTLAIHRLARLARERPRARMIAIAPTEPLRVAIERALVRLGADVEVVTLRAWLRARARRAFPDFPRRRSETPAVVRALKRDPRLDAAVAAIASKPPGRIDDDHDAKDGRSAAHARRADLQHLFGDRALLATACDDEASIEATALHTRRQFSLRAERAHRHVERARRIAIDGRELDDGTPEADRTSADDEDAAVMLEIDRLRARAIGAPGPKLPRYDVIFVDEAQELAPIELRAIAHARAPEGALVVAGDDAQRLELEAETDWDEVLRALDVREAARVTLPRSHRARPALVRAIAGVLAGDRSRVPSLSVSSELAAARAIGDVVGRARHRDPRARTMVIVRDAARAARIERVIGAGRAIVTTIAHARGLEADLVIAADGERYGDDARSRRTLHFALSRARHAAMIVSLDEREARR